MFSNVSKTFHISVDIDGVLEKSDHYLDGMLANNDKKLSAAEVRIFLKEQRETYGYEVYSGCNNVDSKGYCLGHDQKSSPLDTSDLAIKV